MPRTRAKAPPRLTRDAERLIALANGLNASGSVTEDRYWEGEMSTLAARLLENGNDAPIVAWSKYSIPSGTIAPEEADILKVHLQAHVLAEGARLTLLPYLHSIDQLPRHYSELRRLAARLADAAVTGEVPRLDLSRL